VIVSPAARGIPGAGLRSARPRRSGRYGVIAMAMGPVPTVIGLPVMLVAVWIGVTVSELQLVT
jgi:hypothetical protein